MIPKLGQQRDSEISAQFRLICLNCYNNKLYLGGRKITMWYLDHYFVTTLLLATYI